MRSILILLFVGIVNFLYGAGPGQLKGKVTNKKNGEAIIGAVIYFPDLKTGTVTDLDGNYSISNIPGVKTIVQIKELGYRTFILTIDLSSTQTLDVALEESPIEGKEVVITGTSRSTEIKREPVPIVTINQSYLQQNTATNAIDAIAKVPGVSTLTTGPNVSKPFIHGLGFNRVLTLYDGVRQEGQQWGEEHGVEIDQYLIDHIEVIKGPASLIYGSDALAGVVNLLPANPYTPETIKGELSTNYQTNNKLYAGSFSLGGNNKGLMWDARITHKQAMDYTNSVDGRVYGTAFNENDVFAGLGINKQWGYSHINFSLFDALQEIPDGSRDSASRQFIKPITDNTSEIVPSGELNTYKISDIHQHVRHLRLYSTNSLVMGQGRLDIKLGYQQSLRQEFSHPENPDVAGLYLSLNTGTYDLKYYLPAYKQFETTVGVNGMYQVNNTDLGTEFLIPDYKLLDIGPFIFLKKNIGHWDIAAGLRYDMRMFNNTALYVDSSMNNPFNKVVNSSESSNPTVYQAFAGQKQNFFGGSGSFGITYNVSDNFGVKANIARGFRAPNIAELSSFGIHPGTGFKQVGDGNLLPEFSLQEDLGMFFDTRHLSLGLEAFHNMISNYIYDEKLQSLSGGDSLTNVDGNSYQVFKYKQTETRLLGGEIRVDLHPHPFDWLHFENTIAYVRAVNLGGAGAHISDSNKYLPFIPPFHSNSEIRAEIRKGFGPFANIFIKAGVQYYATQNEAYLLYGTETPTPAYTLLDGGFGATVKNKKGQTLFSFTVLGTNLADIAYQSNMSRLKYMDNYPQNGSGRSGIYNMGRNISFKLVIPLSIKRA